MPLFKRSKGKEKASASSPSQNTSRSPPDPPPIVNATPIPAEPGKRSLGTLPMTSEASGSSSRIHGVPGKGKSRATGPPSGAMEPSRPLTTARFREKTTTSSGPNVSSSQSKVVEGKGKGRATESSDSHAKGVPPNYEDSLSPAQASDKGMGRGIRGTYTVGSPDPSRPGHPKRAVQQQSSSSGSAPRRLQKPVRSNNTIAPPKIDTSRKVESGFQKARVLTTASSIHSVQSNVGGRTMCESPTSYYEDTYEDGYASDVSHVSRGGLHLPRPPDPPEYDSHSPVDLSSANLNGLLASTADSSKRQPQRKHQGLSDLSSYNLSGFRETQSEGPVQPSSSRSRSRRERKDSNQGVFLGMGYVAVRRPTVVSSEDNPEGKRQPESTQIQHVLNRAGAIRDKPVRK